MADLLQRVWSKEVSLGCRSGVQKDSGAPKGNLLGSPNASSTATVVQRSRGRLSQSASRDKRVLDSKKRLYLPKIDLKVISSRRDSCFMDVSKKNTEKQTPGSGQQVPSVYKTHPSSSRDSCEARPKTESTGRNSVHSDGQLALRNSQVSSVGWKDEGESLLRNERQCGHCGLACEKFAVANHSQWCVKESVGGKSQPNIVARVVTLGLAPGQIETVYFQSSPNSSERPKTRTLPYSSLQQNGSAIPSTKGSKKDYSSRCVKCDTVVTKGGLQAHREQCKGKHHNSHVTLPHEKELEKASPPQQNVFQGSLVGQARFVVCYICGRQYGSQSIMIHEPQCLKKFTIENKKLPIKERLPLPKKRVLTMDQSQDIPIQGRKDLAESIFEQSYANFAENLVPCNKCGRTFAPDRHRVHQPTCKANPIVKS